MNVERGDKWKLELAASKDESKLICECKLESIDRMKVNFKRNSCAMES